MHGLVWHIVTPFLSIAMIAAGSVCPCRSECAPKPVPQAQAHKCCAEKKLPAGEQPAPAGQKCPACKMAASAEKVQSPQCQVHAKNVVAGMAMMPHLLVGDVLPPTIVRVEHCAAPPPLLNDLFHNSCLLLV